MRDEALFIVDKPEGPSSFDMVRRIKRLYPREKVGHAGSLDPFATGVLVVLLGRATKLSNALLNADKKYRAKIFLGKATDSMDCTGKVTEEVPVPELTAADVEAVLQGLEGEWMQTPPMFSAKKVNGVRLYELARQNIAIPREQNAVQLYSLKLISLNGNELVFEAHCSKGTYVRSLADEIARKLNTVGHLVELRRLACGPFEIEEAKTPDAIEKEPKEERIKGYDHFVRLLRSEAVLRGREKKSVVVGRPSRISESELPRRFINGSNLSNLSSN